MSSLRSTIQRHPNGDLHVFVSGTMDENTDFEDLFGQLDSNTTFNLEGVTRINSIGIHRWIRQIEVLSAQHRVAIEVCSYPICLQAAVVANFFGQALVRSCLAPYFCSTCNVNHTVVVSQEEVLVARGLAPVKNCPSCQAVMEFDELESYFDFMREAT